MSALTVARENVRRHTQAYAAGLHTGPWPLRAGYSILNHNVKLFTILLPCTRVRVEQRQDTFTHTTVAKAAKRTLCVRRPFAVAISECARKIHANVMTVIFQTHDRMQEHAICGESVCESSKY